MMSGTLAASPYTVSFPKWPYSPRWTPWSDVNTIRVSSYMPWDLEEECTYLQCVFSSDVNTITVRRVYVVLHALGSMNERGRERDYSVNRFLRSTYEENIPSTSTIRWVKFLLLRMGKTYTPLIQKLHSKEKVQSSCLLKKIAWFPSPKSNLIKSWNLLKFADDPSHTVVHPADRGEVGSLHAAGIFISEFVIACNPFTKLTVNSSIQVRKVFFTGRKIIDVLVFEVGKSPLNGQIGWNDREMAI